MFNPESPPEIIASRWYNSDGKTTLKGYKGKVVVVAVFQMLCPGSQKYGLPQAMRLRHAFADKEVAVLGLHMAFEKQDEQSPEKVEAFLDAERHHHSRRLRQAQWRKSSPRPWRLTNCRARPRLLVFDRQGRLRRHYLGAVDDLRVGAEVMGLLMEEADSPREFSIAVERRLARRAGRSGCPSS